MSYNYSMERKIVKIQSLPVDTYSFEQAVDYALSVSGQIVTINPEMIAYAKKDEDFVKILEEAILVTPDGIGVEIGLRILGYKIRRIAGIELAKVLIEKFAAQNKRIALVGAKPEVIAKAVENLKNEFNGINIVYVQDGYYADESAVLESIKEAQPDLVLTALGSPKQEFFNYKLKSILPNSLTIGVGGSFDVWSGMVKRAPVIWQKMGLEWLYRTIKEPKRFKRIFPTLPLFVLSVIKERVFKRGMTDA